jgi:hypothetical protein
MATDVEFCVDERGSGSLRAVRVEGPIGVREACVVGHQLLACLNDGALRMLLDLSGAEPLATCALLGTLLRIDRYAASRGVRLVVLSGEGMDEVLHVGNTRGLLTIATTREQAEALLER